MNFAQLQHYAFQYYGIDWLITVTVFISIFMLGNKKREGFFAGMFSSAVGFVFSFQIGSLANGLASFVLFILYLRGMLKWYHEQPRLTPSSIPHPEGDPATP